MREEEEEKKWGDEEREMVVKLVSSLRHSEEDGGNEFIRPPSFGGLSRCVDHLIGSLLFVCQNANADREAQVRQLR